MTGHDPDELKRRSRGVSRDMSPAAIGRRLEIVGELFDVWRLLRTARRIGPVDEAGSGDQVAERPGRDVPGTSP